MAPVAARTNCRRGSYLCENWELRITARCLVEDLGRDASARFEDLLGQDIIKGFVGKRSAVPTDTRRVEPLTSRREVYTLGYGHRHRGATWHDERNGVIWLCAYGRHESGAADEAFPYFKQLDAEGRLLPRREDYESLVEDRNRRFADTIVDDRSGYSPRHSKIRASRSPACSLTPSGWASRWRSWRRWRRPTSRSAPTTFVQGGSTSSWRRSFPTPICAAGSGPTTSQRERSAKTNSATGTSARLRSDEGSIAFAQPRAIMTSLESVSELG